MGIQVRIDVFVVNDTNQPAISQHSPVHAGDYTTLSKLPAPLVDMSPHPYTPL